jgi:urea transporter
MEHSSAKTLPIALPQVVSFGSAKIKEKIASNYVLNEIFLSGSMPKFQEYLASKCFIHKKNHFYILLGVDVILRGVAQVFLCNHPITGIFICIGLSFTSFELLFYALLATAVSTLASLIIAKPNRTDLLAGLCGYDGALVGCACWAFLNKSYSLNISILLSAFAGVIHSSTSNLLSIWQLPPFTFAFNIVMVLFLLAVYNSEITLSLADPTTPTSESTSHNWTHKVTFLYLVDTSLRGVGQFMFVDTTIGSAFVVAGIAISSRAGAFVAVCGAMVGFIMSYYVLHVPGNTHISY